MDDLLVSSLGGQAAVLEERLTRLFGPAVSRQSIPGVFYGAELRFKDGTVISYGWREQKQDGKTFLVPFEETRRSRGNSLQ